MSGLRSRLGWLVVVLTLVTGLAGGLQASDHGADASTANASLSQGDPLQFKTDFAIFSLIVFLVLLGVLTKLTWKPLMDGLAKREKMIADQIAEAKKASLAATEKLKEYEAKLSDAAVKAQELVNQARKDAESVADRIKTEAQQEAARSRDRALAEIESAKASALSELASKSTDIAFVLARRVVGRELNPADHQKLISDAIGNLPSQN